MKLKKLEKAIIFGIVISICVAGFTNFTKFNADCEDIRGRVLRLHILANSDSKEDQQLKLNVRDKILIDSEEYFKTAKTKDEAIDNVRKNLDKIKKTAQNEVIKEGYNYKVNAEIVNMYFTTRHYENVTFPAGYYDAVRITIGEAKGHNWWCVLFPSLCIPAAVDKDKQKVDDVLTQDETEIVTNSDQVVIKFKIVELFEDFKNWLTTEVKI